MAGTAKRPPPSAAAPPPSPKRARGNDPSTPSTLASTPTELDKDAAVDPSRSEDANAHVGEGGAVAQKVPVEAFIQDGSTAHATVAGTRRGDGSNFHPDANAGAEEEYGLMDVSMGAAGEDQGGRMTKDEEAERREIEEAAKGVAVDHAELGEAKEVSPSSPWTLKELEADFVPLRQEQRQLRPAALEELNRIIRFPVIKNDDEPASMILLTGLKCL